MVSSSNRIHIHRLHSIVFRQHLPLRLSMSTQSRACLIVDRPLPHLPNDGNRQLCHRRKRIVGLLSLPSRVRIQGDDAGQSYPHSAVIYYTNTASYANSAAASLIRFHTHPFSYSSREDSILLYCYPSLPNYNSAYRQPLLYNQPRTSCYIL